MNGYLNRKYAESLYEFGKPIYLPNCKGWILKRQIPGTEFYDAMGCYPLFVCKDWSKLHLDLESIDKEIISLSIVTDPHGDYDYEQLKTSFDIFYHFKNHYISVLSDPIDMIVKKSHISSVRRALKHSKVELCKEPLQFLDQWVKLYDNLIKKKKIKGLRKFSKTTFAKQLSIPGIAMFRAICQGNTVGIDIWYEQGDVAYAHLVALDDIGYKYRASYALKWYVMHYFANRVKFLDLGGGLGVENKNNNGLTAFKIGWSNKVLPVYFCGKIFHNDIYSSLSDKIYSRDITYFPNYRYGEIF